jgi:hypothetical protein
MEKLKPLLPLLILCVFAVLVIVYLFSFSHPYGGLFLPLKSSDIVEKSRMVLADMHVNVGDLRPEVQFKVDRPLFRQTQQLFGIGAANKLIRDSIPVYKWSVRWKKENNLQFSLGNEDETTKRQEEEIADFIRGDISIVFDTKGKVLEFNRKFSDSLHLPNLSSAEARLLAIHFLRQQTSETVISDTINIVLEKSTQQPHRTDYEFEWKKKIPVLGNSLRIKIIVAGNVIALYERQVEISDSFKKEKKEGVLGIIYALFIAFTVIGMILIAIRRIRSYEIGFRLALIIGIIVALAFDIELFLNMQQEQTGWQMLMMLLVSPVFIGGALTLLWAVSESIAREVWSEKIISLDRKSVV